MEFILKSGWFKSLFKNSSVIPISILFVICCGIFVVGLATFKWTPSDKEVSELSQKIDGYLSSAIEEEINNRYRPIIESTVKLAIDDAVAGISGDIIMYPSEYSVVVNLADDDCFSYRHGEDIGNKCMSKEEAESMLDYIRRKAVTRTRKGIRWDDI